MDPRHFPNSFGFAGNRGHDRNHLAIEQSHIRTGRPVPLENGHFFNPANNVLRGGYHRTTRWNSETNEYPSSSSMHASHLQPAYSGPTYDPCTRSSGAGNVPLLPQNNSTFSNPSQYWNYNVSQNVLSPQESIPRSRGALKRKGPETSVTYERGSSSSRFYGVGSSSSSYELPSRKPNSSICYSHSEVTCGSSGFSSGEGSSRNVRRRSVLDLEFNAMQTHVPGYPSSGYHRPPTHFPNYREPGNLTTTNGGRTGQPLNFGSLPSVSRGRGGIQAAGASSLSHVNHQLVGSELEIRPRHSDSVAGSNVGSSSQHANAPIQSARGRRSSHSMRSMSPYRTGPRYSVVGHEPNLMEDDDLQTHSLSFFRHSGQYSGGWHNNYSNGSSGLSIERLRSIASIVDAHGRIGSEDFMMNLSASFASSGSLFDQYRDMRLDIDDMSYEELLALGESIGNVNTGLEDGAISKSLTEETYSTMQNNEGEACAVCLEEYLNEVEIGTLRNCGHNYHAACIKKWLSMKNSCPICKVPALKDCFEGKMK